MPQQLSQEKIRRMVGSGGGSVGGGSSFDPSSMAGMASQAWVEQNYLSKAFFSQLFKAFKPGASTSDPDEEVMPNTIDEHITNIKAMFGLWTEQYLSALGQNSGGGGGGVTLNEPLESINGSGMSAPGATEDGKTIVWDNTQQKWKYGAAGGGGGGGTVTSITAGTGLAGGTITTSGTIGLSEETVTAIGKGVTAYNWGNHAQAGYLTSVSFSDLTSHPTTLSGYGITDAYTKTEADAKYMTIAAFENLFNALNSSGNKVSHPYSSGVASIKALVGLWTEQYLSALGQNSGGGGVTLNEPLSSINTAGLGTPTATGQVITWNGSQWIYSIPGGGGGGTVTSITAGTGLAGGTITTSGTIGLSEETVTAIGKGVTAYNWGNHAQAGYLTSVSFSDLTSHPTTLSGYGITDAYTKTEADAKYMTIAAFENLFNALNSSGNKVSHPYSSGVASIKALVGLWTEQYLSALGQNSGGGGGGGTGTVTSITAGTGLSGGTITTMGTIALSTETQTNIGYGVTAYGWGNHANAGYLTSVSFSDLTSHPTTLSGYGITDAYISSGTIYLGSNSITPLTSFTETDPTVPAWAKASSKPSYSFSEITGTIASSQLPTLYWANVQVSSTSSDTTEPKMKSLHLYGTDQFGVGGLLKFGDGSYVYLTEEVDDKLTIYASKGIFLMTGSSYYVGVGTDSPAHKLDVVGDINATLDITTAQAVNARNIELSFTSPFIDFHHASSSADYTSRLITTDYGTLNLQSKTSGGTDKLSGFVVGANYDGSFIQIGNIKIVYDSSNNALKIIKSDGTAANLYATGGVAALGTI